MRIVSTGTGLVVLSATIAACFAVSHFGGEERAFAATPAPFSASQLSAPCASGNATWFSRVPRLITKCGYQGNGEQGFVICQPFNHADINGDGSVEHFAGLGDDYMSYYLDPVAYSTPWVIYLDQVSVEDGGAKQTATAVFEMDQELHSAIKAVVPNASLMSGKNMYQLNAGWRDCDGDGDLDLVCLVSTQSNGSRQIWFENTGFQKAPAPNPYDLDQDGEVGAGDISVLLLNYSK